MALTAQITLGNVCAGGQHFDATVAFSTGQSILEPFQRSDLYLPVTDAERRAFARLLLKMSVGQMPPNATNGEIKQAVEGKVFDFTVPAPA